MSSITQRLGRVRPAAVLAAAVLGGALLVGGGLTFAANGPGAVSAALAAPSGSPATGSTKHASPVGRGLRARLERLARRSDLATFQVRTKDGWQTVESTRGTVATVGGGELTVKLPSGTAVTWATDAQTPVRIDGQTGSLSGLQAGQRVLVFGTRDAAGTVTARLVRAPGPRPAAPKAASPAPSPSPTPAT